MHQNTWDCGGGHHVLAVVLLGQPVELLVPARREVRRDHFFIDLRVSRQLIEKGEQLRVKFDYLRGREDARILRDQIKLVVQSRYHFIVLPVVFNGFNPVVPDILTVIATHEIVKVLLLELLLVRLHQPRSFWALSILSISNVVVVVGARVLVLVVWHFVELFHCFEAVLEEEVNPPRIKVWLLLIIKCVTIAEVRVASLLVQLAQKVVSIFISDLFLKLDFTLWSGRDVRLIWKVGLLSIISVWSRTRSVRTVSIIVVSTPVLQSLPSILGPGISPLICRILCASVILIFTSWRLDSDVFVFSTDGRCIICLRLAPKSSPENTSIRSEMIAANTKWGVG